MVLVAKVLVVPGAAVRRYAWPAVEELRRRGVEAALAAAPGEPGTPADLAEYGRELGARLDTEPVDLLVGLSVGAQVAAVATAAARTEPRPVRRLMLVGPTLDPAARAIVRLVGRWLAGGRAEPRGLLTEQLPDWRRAGPRRIVTLVRSAPTVEVERVLAPLSVPTTVVHAEHDQITSHEYAARLATDLGAPLVLLPGATHSWPFREEEAFADLVAGIVGDPTGDTAKGASS